MPLSTTDWLNITQLDSITAVPVVGQHMWWLCRSESDTEFKMYIVTMTSSSDNGSVITFDSGEVLELFTELFQTHITIHNDIVAKSRGEADPTDMHMAPEDAGEGGASLSNDPPDDEAGNGNAPPSAVQQNNPPHQTASARICSRRCGRRSVFVERPYR